VTHDQVEAMTMSDRVAMMDAGTILQLGRRASSMRRPAERQGGAVHRHPGDQSVAGEARQRRIELFGVEMPSRARCRPAPR
jgi:multiple sugar transport system ATP-binding protein